MEDALFLKITQVRSLIGQRERVKRTLVALGLRKINHTVVHKNSPVLQGMIKKVSHLVKWEATQEIAQDLIGEEK